MTVTSAATERSGRPGEHSIPAVSLRGVHQSFGAVDAVRGIDLTVAPGEVVAFLGPNGAGKTSTIDIILGLARPTRGEVEVYGFPPAAAVAQTLCNASQTCTRRVPSSAPRRVPSKCEPAHLRGERPLLYR